MAVIFCLEDKATGAKLGYGTGAVYQSEEEAAHAFSRLFDDMDGTSTSICRLKVMDGSWTVVAVSNHLNEIMAVVIGGRWSKGRHPWARQVADLREALPFLVERRREQLLNAGGGPIIRHDVMVGIVGGQEVGRNDLCSCGSGQKFKKCCAAK